MKANCSSLSSIEKDGVISIMNKVYLKQKPLSLIERGKNSARNLH
jgi:hypothetical protein